MKYSGFGHSLAQLQRTRHGSWSLAVDKYTQVLGPRINLDSFATPSEWTQAVVYHKITFHKIGGTYYNPVHRCHRDSQRLRRICSAVAYNMSY